MHRGIQALRYDASKRSLVQSHYHSSSLSPFQELMKSSCGESTSLDRTWKSRTPNKPWCERNLLWTSETQLCSRTHLGTSSYKNVRLFESSEEHNGLCSVLKNTMDSLNKLQWSRVEKGASLLGKIHVMDHLEFVRMSIEPFDLNVRSVWPGNGSYILIRYVQFVNHRLQLLNHFTVK